MRHILFILFIVAMGFNCVAQNNKGISSNEVNRVRKELVNQVLNPMRQTAYELERDINNAEALYSRLKDREYTAVAAQPGESDDLEAYLRGFSSLQDMFRENDKSYDRVLNRIRSSDGSDLRTLYLLIFAMNHSLKVPYDETTNNLYIEQAADSHALLEGHEADYSKLVSQINDYNYYMFELARIFTAFDEELDNYRPADWQSTYDYMKDLLNREDAMYLFDVPFTQEMLYNYIHSSGNMPDNYKKVLYDSNPDAFPDYKY